MTNWESLEYRGQPYVRITPTARGRPSTENGREFKPQLLYAASGKLFFLTPSESVLKRALDRQAMLEEANKDTGKNNSSVADGASKQPAGDKLRESRPWLGENVGLQVDRQLLPLLATAFGEQFQQWMQTQAWNNLPILNEWHTLYPDQDPVDVHEQIWKERLICPGGGKYIWNDEWKTMESTIYGHPGVPKLGPGVPPELFKFRFGNFGVTFEEQGLRARLMLDREVTEETSKDSPKP